MKKTVLGTALTLLIAAFTFSSCSSSDANGAEKTTAKKNPANKEQAAMPKSINPNDTLKTKSPRAKNENSEASEKHEMEDKD